MAEPKPVAARTVQMEYRFDRLLPDKLAQAYHLLVPDRRRRQLLRKGDRFAAIAGAAKTNGRAELFRGRAHDHARDHPPLPSDIRFPSADEAAEVGIEVPHAA